MLESVRLFIFEFQRAESGVAKKFLTAAQDYFHFRTTTIENRFSVVI